MPQFHGDKMNHVLARIGHKSGIISISPPSDIPLFLSPPHRPSVPTSRTAKMRLINTETLQLVECFSDIPRYAILSHRWEAEEVNFQAYPSQLRVLSRGGSSSSCEIRIKGLDKIERCAAQARSDRLPYC